MGSCLPISPLCLDLLGCQPYHRAYWPHLSVWNLGQTWGSFSSSRSLINLLNRIRTIQLAKTWPTCCASILVIFIHHVPLHLFRNALQLYSLHDFPRNEGEVDLPFFYWYHFWFFLKMVVVFSFPQSSENSPSLYSLSRIPKTYLIWHWPNLWVLTDASLIGLWICIYWDYSDHWLYSFPLFDLPNTICTYPSNVSKFLLSLLSLL